MNIFSKIVFIDTLSLFTNNILEHGKIFVIEK
jgi:hypothetical protein